MAEVRFNVIPDAVVDATLQLAGPMSTGDSTTALTINQGDSDVSIHVYGTAGGSSVVITGSLTGATFGSVDDAYGSPMSFTTLGVIKPLGPAVQAIKGSVVGGAGSGIFIAVYIVKRGR